MNEGEIQKEINEKQQYLREEIKNKNYDIDEFSEYMSQYKENGLDLINWSLDELKEAVKKFKNKNKVQSKEEEEKIIEKGVENIRQSYILNQYPDFDSSNTTNNIDINNNNVNINYDYNVINYNNLKNSNLYSSNSNKNQSNNLQFINDQLNINKPNFNSGSNQKEVNVLNTNEYKNSNNNNPNNQINANNKLKDSEFEVLDDSNINNYDNSLKEKIECIRQPQNSLTNKDNLNVVLES
jgi:hypothetical protein